MRALWSGVAVIALAAATAAAQSAGTQSTTSATGNTTVSAPQSGAQAQTNAGVQAQQETGTSGQQTGSQTAGQASGSAQASAAGTQTNANIASGTTIQAVLDKSLDSKKAKPGDKVAAKTTEDVKSGEQVVIPRGSKIIGRLVQANTQGQGSAKSALAIVFDHAELKNGGTVALNAVIQALAPPASSLMSSNSASTQGGFEPAGAPMGGGPSAAPGGGGVIGSATGAVGGTVNAAGNTVGGVAGGVAGDANAGALGQGISSNGQLTNSATGVIGMPGVQLATISSQSEQGSVILSKDKRLRLESGTQMTLKASGNAPQQK